MGKKFLTALISLLTATSIGLTASAYSSNTNEMVITDSQMQEMLEIANLQREAVEAHEFFENSLPFDDNGQFIYPDTYAGEYIDDDGNLIFQVTTSDFTEYEYLYSLYSCVKIEQVQYSYNYLNDLIDEYWMTYDASKGSVAKSYVDVSKQINVAKNFLFIVSPPCERLKV